MNTPVKKLKEMDKEIQLLSHSAALLGWDQETYMPKGAIEERARQQSVLSGIIHDRLTDSKVGRLLESAGVTETNLSGDPGAAEDDRFFLRKFAKEYYREIKIPRKLITEFSEAASLSQAKWIEAREKADFSIFAPHLQKILDLTLKKAEYLGYGNNPYDALIDEFEPFAKTDSIRRIFTTLKPGLTDLVGRIADSDQPDESFLLRKFPVHKQESFGREVLVDMGFDFNKGRLDVSAHPFTTSPGSDDIRITTRYQERFFKTGIFGIIHECGHALYEQGFDDSIKTSVLGQGTSLGIHESQSRTWENLIGRSLPFWRRYFPRLKEIFPGQLEGVSLSDFYRAINRVEPSLIRVEADEVTYTLHVILRFEIELDLVAGNIEVRNLPEIWNSKMEELLGIRPSNDSEGVLQDIHWSFGAIGYFPTYALGNLYGAQFFDKMKKDLGSIDSLMENGDFGPVLEWLRNNIHRHGSIYTADELCVNVTGESLNPSYFIKYLEDKYRNIYNIK